MIVCAKTMSVNPKDHKKYANKGNIVKKQQQKKISHGTVVIIFIQVVTADFQMRFPYFFAFWKHSHWFL